LKIKSEEDKLSSIGVTPKSGSAKTDDIAAMINKAMKKAEGSVAGITSKTSVNRMQKMDVAGKNVTLERLKGLRDALDGVIRMLEKGNT
jgi:hypothetical protein